MRTCFFTLLALVAFAANSVLCRLALDESTIDAASFSSIRILSGAMTLWLILAVSVRKLPRLTGSWLSAVALCVYAIPFSFAYIGLEAGTGALILFGAVQITMMGAALWIGERPDGLQWLGMALAAGGLVYLFLPGLAAPPLWSGGLMALAGVGWGVYSILGKEGSNPLANTTSNFVRSIPIVVTVSLLAWSQMEIQMKGAVLAMTSGSITSGIGYAIWYLALKELSATQASVVQLSVPVLAAIGGVFFLAELITVRLAISTVVVLGGVWITLVGKKPRQSHSG